MKKSDEQSPGILYAQQYRDDTELDKFMRQFSVLPSLSHYECDSWDEMTGILYDNNLTISSKPDYSGLSVDLHLIKHIDRIVGYGGFDRDDPSIVRFHVDSRYEIEATR